MPAKIKNGLRAFQLAAVSVLSFEPPPHYLHNYRVILFKALYGKSDQGSYHVRLKLLGSSRKTGVY